MNNLQRTIHDAEDAAASLADVVRRMERGYSGEGCTQEQWRILDERLHAIAEMLDRVRAP